MLTGIMYKLLKVKYILVIDGRDVSWLLMLRECADH